jgi:hypothetical protein
MILDFVNTAERAGAPQSAYSQPDAPRPSSGPSGRQPGVVSGVTFPISPDIAALPSHQSAVPDTPTPPEELSGQPPASQPSASHSQPKCPPDLGGAGDTSTAATGRTSFPAPADSLGDAGLISKNTALSLGLINRAPEQLRGSFRADPQHRAAPENPAQSLEVGGEI